MQRDYWPSSNSVDDESGICTVSDLSRSVTQPRQIDISIARSVGPKNKSRKPEVSMPPKIPNSVQIKGSLTAPPINYRANIIICHQGKNHAIRKQSCARCYVSLSYQNQRTSAKNEFGGERNRRKNTRLFSPVGRGDLIRLMHNSPPSIPIYAADFAVIWRPSHSAVISIYKSINVLANSQGCQSRIINKCW